MHNITGFQRDCLYAIAGLDAPKGLAIKETLDEYYASEINHGRLYPNLDTLVEKGLVEKNRKDDRTNAYTLTGAGEEMVIERRQWEAETAELPA